MSTASNRSDRPAASLSQLLVIFLTFIRFTTALQYVSGSSCASLCSTDVAGTLEDDIVCVDEDYQENKKASSFQKCVGCLLNSTAVDTTHNISDVEWGLYNLRVTLSTCMFGIPEERVSISSPCQVTCQPLNQSIGYNLGLNQTNGPPSLDFCFAGQFDDLTINNCAFCYSFIPQQLFLANFLQALHIECRQPPTFGNPFFPDADAIFNETLIAGPAPPSNSTSNGGGLHGWQLGVAIAVPIVGGGAIIALGCWGCFIFTRKRRRDMASTGRMSRVHMANAEGKMFSPVSPVMENGWGKNDPPQEMERISPGHKHGKFPSPGIAQGRWSLPHPPEGGYEDGTPQRASFQHDEVGPGADQVQDHAIHEQYFGVADGGQGEVPIIAGPSGAGLGVYQGSPVHDHGYKPDEEHGHWAR